MENLNNILEVLLRNEIEFVIIGGFAAVVHGSSQVTKDLDICLCINDEQIENLRKCLKPFNPKHRTSQKKLSFLEHPQDASGTQNIYLETDLGVLDIISEVKGVGDFERVLRGAIEIELFGHSCKVISLEDLIDSKKSMSREKDLTTTKELEILLLKKK